MDIPTKYKLCCNTNVYLTEQDSLGNTFISRCSYFKCRKKHFLKEFTIFDAFPQTMASTILYILKLWIIESKNGAEIHSKIINDFPNFTIS